MFDSPHHEKTSVWYRILKRHKMVMVHDLIKLYLSHFRYHERQLVFGTV